MKKVLYILGLTSVVFLLSAAEKQKESWTEFVLGVGQRVGRLIEAGAGAAARGAEALFKNHEEQIDDEEFIETGSAQLIGHQYQEVENKLDYLHSLVIKAHFKEYSLLSDVDKDKFETFIQEFKRQLTFQKIAAQVSGKVDALERSIKNTLEQEASKQHKIKKLTELYDNFVKKTALDMKELKDVLGEE